jgi:hypothetical protein
VLSDQAGGANGGIGLLLEVVGYRSWGGTPSHGGGAVDSSPAHEGEAVGGTAAEEAAACGIRSCACG